MYGGDREPRMNCAIDATMSVIEGRWKTVILCKLSKRGPMRFNQLIKDIDGVSPRVLTKQLRELEADGVIIRNAYPEIPPRVEYSMSEKGMTLAPLLISMAQWGIENMFSNKVTMGEDIKIRCTGVQEELLQS